MEFKNIQPYIRYVNNYKPAYSYTEKERIIYDYELMYVMEGEVEMHYGDVTYWLKKSDVFYLKPNVRNYIVVEESKHFRTHCIHFDWLPPAPEEDFTAEEFYMHSFLSQNHYERVEGLKYRSHYEPEDLSLPNHISGVSYERLSALFAKCYYGFLDKSAASQLRIRAAFLEILAELAEYQDRKAGGQPVHPRIIQAMEYIRANYTQSLKVPWLAEKYGLSPKYFGTLFKEATGKNVGEFILDLRLYDAREMLLGTHMTIEEIAERTGFQNAFYFSKCFKDKEKLAPSGYRSMMRG